MVLGFLGDFPPLSVVTMSHANFLYSTDVIVSKFNFRFLFKVIVAEFYVIRFKKSE